MQYKHREAETVRNQMCMSVQNTAAFRDYTFNLGMWKWRQTNNGAP